MTLREILSGTSSWLRAHRYEQGGSCEPDLDDDGLLTAGLDPEDDFNDTQSAAVESEPIVVKTVTSMDRREPMERLQEGFNQLVDQLQQINDHLDRQLSQHDDLMDRVKQLPHMLETLPSAVENQKQLTAQLLEQLKSTTAKDRQFMEVVERIPEETARQTDTLIDINHQLAAASDIDVQFAGSINKFKMALDRLNDNTMGNTEGILQMSRTFAASDRYLKDVVARLSRRYTWTLAGALGVCAAVIASLVGIVIYLAN